MSRDAHVNQRVTVNWRAGLQAAGVSICLLGISSSTGTAAPAYAAAAVASYALLVPFQAAAFLTSSVVLKWTLKAASASAALGALAWALALSSGSSVTMLSVPANLAFIVLMLSVAFIAARMLICTARDRAGALSWAFKSLWSWMQTQHPWASFFLLRR